MLDKTQSQATGCARLYITRMRENCLARIWRSLALPVAWLEEPQ